MDRKAQRAAALAKAREVIDAAKAANRDLTDSEIETYDEAMADVKRIDKEIKRAEDSDRRMRELSEIVDEDEADEHDRKSKDGGQGGMTKALTLGHHFVAECGKSLQGVKGKRFTLSSSEYDAKAATDVQVSPLAGAGLDPLVTQYDTRFVTGVRRRLTVADLMPNTTLTSARAVTYFIEGALEGDFANVAENATKPQMHFADPTSVTEALKKIAGYIKESDEMVEDFGFMIGAINGRLLYQLALREENQLLSGDGTGQNLRGLLNRSGIQTMGLVADPKSGNFDTLYKAITAVETGSGFTADGIVINPTDYQNLRLTKDGNSQYYGGGPFTGEYGVGGVLERPPIWGVRTVVTPAIAAGTVLVAAFQPSSEIYRKGGVRVESTNSNEADFINNRVTIRVEERLLLAVRVPAALVKVTLGTA